jgi:muramoyltetrapeptide carboxypeptidase
LQNAANRVENIMDHPESHSATPPPFLQPGATVGIIAPASPFSGDELDRAVAYLTARGLQVKEGAALHQERRYLAGSDTQRLADVHAMFADPQVRAIFVPRGGYGCTRLLDSLDYTLIAANPTALVGLSDLTALQFAIFAKTGLVSFTGSVLCPDFGRTPESPMVKQTLWPALEQHQFESLTGLQSIRGGRVSGPLLPGCLSVIQTLAGTPYLPDFNGAILLVEDVNEAPYKIDRMLNHLRMLGVLEQLGGLAFGQFTGCTDERYPDALAAIFAEFADIVDGPVVAGVPYGHENDRVVLPVGMTAMLDGNAGVLVPAAE